MNIFTKMKERFNKKTKKNLPLAILSLFIAIGAWLVISMTFYKSITMTINDVPLDIDISGTNADENGLSLISCDVEKVNVRILGSRTQIGNFDSDSIKASIIADNVSTAGEKTLKIGVESTNPDVEIEIEEITPSTATVVFDKYETREFQIEPSIPNITFAEGKTKNNDEFKCDPEVINITGPVAQLNKIDKVQAVTTKEAVLDTSYSVTNDEIELFTEDGAVIEQSQFKFDNTNFQIYIPVLTQKTVALSVGIVGTPPNFDKDCIKLKYSDDTITIASKTAQLSEIPEELEIGNVLLSELVPGFRKTFNIELGDYINISNIDTVTVSLDDSELSQKMLVIDKFEISNAPSGYDFEVLTKRIDVVVVGPEEIINDITSNDIIATVNLLYATGEATEGESFNYDVTLTCPNYDNVWAATQAKVILSRTEQPDTTAAKENG